MATKTTSKTEGKEKKPVTSLFTLSFPHLDKRAVYDGEEEKFEITCLFDPADAGFKALHSKVLKETVAVYGAKEKWPKKFHWPFKKGEEFTKKDSDEVLDGYEGKAVLKMKSDFPVKVFNKKREEIDVDDYRDEVYGGAICRASYKINVFDKKGSKGVAVILLALQKMEDGTRFGDGGNAADAFDDELSESNDSDDFGADGGEDEDLGF